MWSGTFVKISLIGVASVGVGLGVNHFRGQAFGLRYSSKQERLDLAVAKVDKIGPDQPTVASAASDQERLKAFSELINKKSENAYGRTLDVWKQGVSVEFLRSVISIAKKKMHTTDEAEMLELMLKALDDPAAQWRECERLSRGNSLEKSVASSRVAVFELNPRIKAARDSGPIQTSFPSADHPQEVSWQMVQALEKDKKAIIVDARPEKLFHLGHIPGAINISREQFAADYAKQKSSLESDKERPVAVYCNGLDCEDSIMVSGALIKLGFRRVLIFKGGWKEWTYQHLPEEK